MPENQKLNALQWQESSVQSEMLRTAMTMRTAEVDLHGLSWSYDRDNYILSQIFQVILGTAVKWETAQRGCLSEAFTQETSTAPVCLPIDQNSQVWPDLRAKQALDLKSSQLLRSPLPKKKEKEKMNLYNVLWLKFLKQFSKKGFFFTYTNII